MTEAVNTQNVEQRNGSRLPPVSGSEPECEHGRSRNEEYDAYYCPKCGTWLEPRCEDPECEMCGDRPPKAPNATEMSHRQNQE